MKEFYRFGYDHIVRKAQTIDVLWFNSRRMPSKLFEVEHSADIQNALLKFLELQDYHADFFIVADRARKKEFEGKISLSAFTPIEKRVRFLDYAHVSEWHAKTHEMVLLEKLINWR